MPNSRVQTTLCEGGRTDGRTDRQTDRRTDGQAQPYIPSFSRGINTMTLQIHPLSIESVRVSRVLLTQITVQ